MKFAVGVFDTKQNRTVLEGARADQKGIFVILEVFTTLEPNGRNKFVRDAIGLGVASYTPGTDEEAMQYSVTAMRL